MNTGLGIYQLLQASTDVTDLVGTRVFPSLAAQGATMPFVTYEIMQITPSDEKDGPSEMDEVRVEVACFADRYSVAVDLGTKVRTALDRMALQGDGISIQSIRFHDVTDEMLDSPRRFVQVHDYTVRQNRDNSASLFLGQPVTVTDGDGTEVTVQPGGTYSCIPTTAPTGIFYQRQIPWDGNDPRIDYSVAWHVAAGTYEYSPPNNPASIAALRNGYVGGDGTALLMQQNRFGNTYRFTNDRGQQFTEGFAFSAANTSENPRMCMDHLTGLAYYVEKAYDDIFNRTIAEAIASAKNFTYAGHADWRLADAAEYLNAVNYNDWNNSYHGVYTPFVDNNIRNYGGQLWLGSYTKDNEFTFVNTNGGTISRTTSSTYVNHHRMMVRTFYND